MIGEFATHLGVICSLIVEEERSVELLAFERAGIRLRLYGNQGIGQRGHSLGIRTRTGFYYPVILEADDSVKCSFRVHPGTRGQDSGSVGTNHTVSNGILTGINKIRLSSLYNQSGQDIRCGTISGMSPGAQGLRINADGTVLEIGSSG